MDKIQLISDLYKSLEGYKTYIAAIGLIGLGVYQLSVNDVAGATQSLMTAFAAFGVRNAIRNNEVKLLKLTKKD